MVNIGFKSCRWIGFALVSKPCLVCMEEVKVVGSRVTGSSRLALEGVSTAPPEAPAAPPVFSPAQRDGTGQPCNKWPQQVICHRAASDRAQICGFVCLKKHIAVPVCEFTTFPLVGSGEPIWENPGVVWVLRWVWELVNPVHVQGLVTV